MAHFSYRCEYHYCIRTKVPEKFDLQTDSEKDRRNLTETMQQDESRNHRSGSKTIIST